MSMAIEINVALWGMIFCAEVKISELVQYVLF
jgi:hypothetical protein